MSETRDELHEDLMALLGAGRELSPDADADLVRVFLDRRRIAKREPSSDRHWIISKTAASLAFIGVVWLVAVAILAYVPYYYYTHDSDVLGGYYTQTLPAVLIVALALSLLVLAANATEWRLPRIRIIIPPTRPEL